MQMTHLPLLYLWMKLSARQGRHWDCLEENRKTIWNLRFLKELPGREFTAMGVLFDFLGCVGIYIDSEWSTDVLISPPHPFPLCLCWKNPGGIISGDTIVHALVSIKLTNPCPPPPPPELWILPSMKLYTSKQDTLKLLFPSRQQNNTSAVHESES